jgi:SAM-dependent methyltransferase
MKTDRARWNRKHGAAEGESGPAEVVAGFASWAREGRALDIAAGKGRHSLFLAQAGFTVDAVDISDVGLKKIGDHPRINPICTDLDLYEIEPGAYDLIVNINFFLRRLFPQIIEGLKPGGVLIFETFVEGHQPPDEEGHRREYLLRANELLRTFLALRVVYYREWCRQEQAEGVRTAALVGIKPA